MPITNIRKNNPLTDIIAEVEQIEHDAPSELDKRYHRTAAKHVEAIGCLMKTILDLDKQNQKLEKTNIGLQKAAVFLGVVALLFTIQQATSNIYLATMFTIIVSTVVYFWMKRS